MEGAATLARSCDCNYFVIQDLDQIASHFIPRGTQENPISHLGHGLHRGILRPLQIECDLPIPCQRFTFTFKVRTDKIDVKYLAWFDVMR